MDYRVTVTKFLAQSIKRKIRSRFAPEIWKILYHLLQLFEITSRVKKKTSLGADSHDSHAYNPIRDFRRDSWRDVRARVSPRVSPRVSNRIIYMTLGEAFSETRFFFMRDATENYIEMACHIIKL